MAQTTFLQRTFRKSREAGVTGAEGIPGDKARQVQSTKKLFNPAIGSHRNISNRVVLCNYLRIPPNISSVKVGLFLSLMVLGPVPDT